LKIEAVSALIFKFLLYRKEICQNYSKRSIILKFKTIVLEKAVLALKKRNQQLFSKSTLNAHYFNFEIDIFVMFTYFK